MSNSYQTFRARCGKCQKMDRFSREPHYWSLEFLRCTPNGGVVVRCTRCGHQSTRYSRAAWREFRASRMKQES